MFERWMTSRTWVRAAVVSCSALAAMTLEPACSRDPIVPGDSANADPEAVGNVRLALTGSAPAEVASVEFTLKGQGLTKQQTVPVEDHGLPGSVSSAAAGETFADALFVVPVGAYEVSARLLGADGKAVATCQVEQPGHALVQAGATAEIQLAASCASGQGGLDVSVAIDRAPYIDGIEIPGGKFLCVDETAGIAASATDPDGDPITLSWKVTPPPGLDDGSYCLGSLQGEAAFAPSAAGTYQVTVAVRDAHSQPQSLTFPLYVSDCGRAPLCTGTRADAALPMASVHAGRCACDSAGYTPKLFDAGSGVSGLGVMPPYLRNPRRVLIHRKLGAAEEVDCPDQGGWIGKAAFVPASCNDSTLCMREVDCGYTWTANSAPDYSALSELSGNFACDQPVMTGHGPLDWIPKQVAYQTRVDLAANFGTLGSRGHTQVAVIDSAIYPYDNDQNEPFGHGRSVGRIIADLSCPGSAGECASRIHNYLALDHSTPSELPGSVGGQVGDFQSLAFAIHHALDDWQNVDKGVDPLIINLSLGWDPRHIDKLNQFRSLRAPGECPFDEPHVLADAVHTALARASCLGALVVAAAGNADVPGDDTGMIFPAAWEAESETPGDQCAQFAIPANWPRRMFRQASGYRPLVYAATGVGEPVANKPTTFAVLGNTRLGGVARLAGEGLSVVTSETRTGAEDGHTLAFGGSSFGAASVSGVAAAVWNVNPSWDPNVVMEMLYETGIAPTHPGQPVTANGVAVASPDVVLPGCPFGFCTETRAVSHCQALLLALSQNMQPSMRGTLGCPSQEVVNPVIPAAADPSLLTPLDFNNDVSLNNGHPVWGSHYVPWIRPTPDPPRCPPVVCGLHATLPSGAPVEGEFKGQYDTPLPALLGVVLSMNIDNALIPDSRRVFGNLFGLGPPPSMIDSQIHSVQGGTRTATLMHFFDVGGTSISTEPLEVDP